MSAPLPIKFRELLQLPSVGLSEFTFGNVTLSSEKFICTREAQGGKPHVNIVDLSNGSVQRMPAPADSAIMNPDSRILALKAGNQLQVFHLEEKRKVKEHTMDEAVRFWCWISGNTIAMVTDTAVFHWSLEGSFPPAKIFDRRPNLAGTQLISYRTDHAQKWCVLIGIKQQDGRVVGQMQLYSVDRKISQELEGSAAAFTLYQVPGAERPSTLFSFVVRSATAAKLYVLEVGGDGSSGFQKRAVEFQFPREAAGDFPVRMETARKFGTIFLVTKFGFLYVFDLLSGKTIFMNRIGQHTVFASCYHQSADGLLGINAAGQVLSISMDENTVVPYIANQLGDVELALSIASRNNLPGAEDLVQQQFGQALAAGDVAKAARVAATSPNGILRNSGTIQRFKSMPAQPGQAPPLLQYFSIIIDSSKLNELESLELARPVLQQGKGQLLEKWLQEDKLSPTEELGDFVRQHDLKLALSMYHKAEVKHKVIACLAEMQEYDKIVAYAKKVGYQADWAYLLQNVVAANPQGAVGFAQMLLGAAEGPMVDVNMVIDCFMQRNLVAETTSILLDLLKENKPEQGELQTRLLEINLVHKPAVADAIIEKYGLSHYDKDRIAQICEKVGLAQRALQLYTRIEDAKRVMLNTHAIQLDFLVDYFQKLSAEDAIDCMRELLRSNRQQNMQICVKIAQRYSEKWGTKGLIELFESFSAYDGIFYFLSQLVATSEDADVIFKYIEAACKTGNFQEVERIVRESNHYDPPRVKEFLKEAKLADQVPLIIVCDRFDFIEDLTRYLYKNNMSRYIEIYVTQVNSAQTPAVIGALLDLDCNEDYIRNLVKAVGGACPIDDLVAQVEKRNRLKLLFGYLEDRLKEGNQEAATHNAMCKIYIDMNKDPESVLLNNPFYDSRVVGAYCENRDPHLAFVAYKRGQCDDELLAVTNKNGLFRSQARYLVERRDPALFAKVLDEENQHRRSVIDQVVQTALPESQDPDDVSATVKAFMAANLPNELIELLEKIVLEKSGFSGNRNLQNLLILTAIKADPSRVMNYITRLENFDGLDIANIALDAELFEEAFVVFKKFELHTEAIDVLLNHMKNIERAYEFAERVREPAVFRLLGRAQLNASMVKEAIDSFIKAESHEFYEEVIEAANREGTFEDLVRYLRMCRLKFKESKIETELAWALAKTHALSDLDDLVSGPNSADILAVGDRCFTDGLYEAAKLLFNNISNFARLATTLVKLEDFAGGVDAARKANSTRTWKEVAFACVEAAEFRLAQICGLHIVIHADELEQVVDFYEARGHTEELLALIENGLNLERAHVGMFTELAVLYSKYKPQKLMEHIKLFYNRMNIPKVLRACEKGQQWPELTFLYIHYDEYDNAALVMIKHPVDAWDHSLFKDVIVKVANLEIYYKAIEFYLECQPLKLNDLLMVLAQRIDHTRTVNLVRKLGHLAAIKAYLLSVQEANILAVNVAVNEQYIEEEDFTNLRTSIDSYSNIDTLALARTLEKHDLIEFRRIAAYLYKENGRADQSIALSKADCLWKDAIETAACSKKAGPCEELLRFFTENGRKDCFAACLYTCYDYIRPDVVLELAWRNDMMDFAMPYLVQMLKESSEKLKALDERVFPKQEEGEEMMGGGGPPPMMTGAPPPMMTGPGGMMPGGPPGMMMTGPAGFAPPGQAPGMMMTGPAAFARQNQGGNAFGSF
eukprot:TRINITY_DN3190_c0_g1_i1.p1 TRINITY_DN3190_c0_g1~~TRINITY_DN3190_c0_g1_i1.p1  ORF type:complete len:1694 (+),score=825.21 TRINITY_DN3190_c0_g1_i1:167-5248(+)